MTRLHSTLRVVVGIVAVLIFASGFLVIATGGADAPIGIWALCIGGLGIIAVVLERNRYRSEAAERAGAPTGPGGGEEGPVESRFQRTDEVFVDPTTGIRMRVYADPQTGERRYRAESGPQS